MSEILLATILCGTGVLVAMQLLSIAAPHLRVWPLPDGSGVAPRIRRAAHRLSGAMIGILSSGVLVLAIVERQTLPGSCLALSAFGSIILCLGATLGLLGYLRLGPAVSHGHPGPLVASGPYRFSRNPQYVGAIAVLLGFTTALGSGRGLMTTRVAISIAIVATICFQVGLVLQKVGADRLPRLGLTVRQGRVYLAFLRSPIWLAGFGITTFGWVLLLKAIANAPVSIVQPVLGFGLALLALFSVVFLKEQLSMLESGGIVMMIAGLVLLGVSTARHEEPGAVSLAALLAVSVAAAGGLSAAFPLGRSGRVPLPVVLGFGSGILIGLASLYTKGLFLSLDARLPLLAWLVFFPLMIAANICGLWLMQAGLQQGRALIVAAVSTVTTKVVAIVGGIATLGEVLPEDSAFPTARVAGLVLILLGTVVLSRFGGEQVSPRL